MTNKNVPMPQTDYDFTDYLINPIDGTIDGEFAERNKVVVDKGTHAKYDADKNCIPVARENLHP